MQVIPRAGWLGAATFGVAVVGLTLSVLALYYTLFWWSEAVHAPLYVQAANWLFIVAGAVALLLRRNRPVVATIIVTLQLGLIGFLAFI